MSTKLALILVILIPIAICQFKNYTPIYFPDDEKFVLKSPSAGGFSANPVSSGFTASPVSSGFAANPVSGGFGANSVSSGFAANPVSGGCGANSVSSGFAATPLSSQANSEIRGSLTYEQYVDQLIAKGIAKLTVAINKAYKEKAGDENVVFAPLNIAAALALILLGSNGKTFQELSLALGFATGLEIDYRSEQVHEQLGRMIRKIETTAGVVIGQQVSFADAVFVQSNFPIRKLYKEAAENYYRGEVLNVDFQTNPTKAKQVVNAWVSDRTNGKINEILNDVPSDTKVVIASAMYFKAQWEMPFMEEVTARRSFFSNGRKAKATSEVDMMANLGDFPYYKDNNLEVEILGLPYKGNATVMYVVMPFNSNIQRLKEFETRITDSDLEYLAGRTLPTSCQILFPKMKIESTIQMKPVLRSLGITSLFNPSEANLSLMSPGAGSILTKTDSEINPLASFKGNPNDVLIFSRSGATVNCSAIFDPTSNVSSCEDTQGDQKVMYKKFGDKVGRRIARGLTDSKDTIDSLRHLINQQSTDNGYQNPGLYAENVIHKVYMDITETGTEAAASTLVTVYRSFRGVTFRVDVPFLFFIRHEETKTILFWGSVYNPPTNYRTG